MRNHFDRPTTPGAARGLLPLIMAAMNVAKGAYGAIQSNQQKQRNKGYISANARLATDKLQTRQQDIAQSSTESMIARGLGGAGQEVSPIRQAMGMDEMGNLTGRQATRVGETPSGPPAPTTLGGQASANLDKEFGLEWTDLSQQTKQAHAENKAAGINGEIGALVQGGTDAVTGYNAAKDLQSTPKVPSPISSAMQIPGAFGVDPVDPLGPGSAWHPGSTPKTINGVGQSNYDFGNG